MKNSWRRRSLPLCAAALLALSGCGIDHIRTLREAEQTFSRAAEQENRLRHAQLADTGQGVSGAALTGDLADSTGYRVAAEMTGKLIREKRAELEQDKLLCTAYVIRAFSLWRLGEFAQAVETSRQPCGDASAAPRDRALLRVVDALVGIDESNARIANKERSEAEYQTTKTQIDQALAKFADADAGLARGHPLRAYLFAARFAALRVAQVAPNREGLTGTAESAPRTEALARVDEMLLEYRRYLRCQLRLTGIPEHTSVSHWATLFGKKLPVNAVACDS